MVNQVLLIIMMQSLFLLILLIIFISLFRELNYVKGKIIFSTIAGVIGFLMVFIDSYNYNYLNYIIYTMTIRLFFISIIAIYSGTLPSTITIIYMVVGRLFFWGFNEMSLLIIVNALFFASFTFLISKIFHKKNFYKWLINCFLVLIISTLYLLYYNENILYILYHLIFSVFLISIISFFLLTISRVNNEYLKYYRNSRIDYISNVFNFHYINQIYEDSLKNNKDFKLAILNIDNFKLLKATFKFNVCNEIIYDIGLIIKNYLNNLGVVGKVSNDQYCILFYTDQDFLLNILNDIKNEIEKYIDKFTNQNHIRTKLFINFMIIDSNNLHNQPLTMTINNLKNQVSY